MLTSESRGLQSRGTEQVNKTPVKSQNEPIKESIVITEALRAAAEKAVRNKVERKAGNSMKVWSIVLSYYIADRAQSFEDVTVIARVTYKLAAEKPAPKDGNYTSEVNNYSLAELIFGDRSTGRQPVTTSQMIDNKSEELKLKEKKKLTELVKKMREGELENPGKELEKMANDRRRLARVRLAKLDKNSSDKEFADAIDDVASAQYLSYSTEDDILMEQIAKKQQEKLEESRKRYKNRPESQVQQRQLLRDSINQQKLDEVDDPKLNAELENFANKNCSLDLDMVKSLAYKYANGIKPSGSKYKSIDVDFNYNRSIGWMVEISITEETIGNKGLPIMVLNNFSIPLKQLLSQTTVRQPIVPIR